VLFFSILALTAFRAIFSPILIVLHAIGYLSDLGFTCIFFFLALSDGLDGFLARKFRVVSSFGAWLDHVSDKIFMAVFFTYWLILNPNRLLIVLVMATLIRELIALALRAAPLPSLGNQEHFSVALLGKAKTATQAFSLLLWCLSLLFQENALVNAAYWVLGASLFLSWISLFQYIFGLRRRFYLLYITSRDASVASQ